MAIRTCRDAAFCYISSSGVTFSCLIQTCRSLKAQLKTSYRLSNGDPITGKVLSALATGNPDKINTLLDNSGYDVQPEGLQKALKSADPGSDFDLSVGKAIPALIIHRLLTISSFWHIQV